MTQLNVPEIIVLGHERCGGINAALTGAFRDAEAGEGGFVARWMSQIAPVAAKVAEEHGTGAKAAELLEEEAIRNSIRNLRGFPFVAERENSGNLKLLGCRFSISEAQLHLLDEAEDCFRLV